MHEVPQHQLPMGTMGAFSEKVFAFVWKGPSLPDGLMNCVATSRHICGYAGNYFIGNIIQMLGEGFALVEKAGLPKDVLMNIIKLMFNAPSFISYGEFSCCGKRNEILHTSR